MRIPDATQPPICISIDDLFEVSEQDFMVTVPAGWSTFRLNQELQAKGLIVPRYGSFRHEFESESPLNIASGFLFDSLTVGESVGWNHPHLLEGQHGNWRDWIFEATYLLASGELCRSGARISKNVAGFDFHKFIVGSRGAFVLPVSFTLRVIPRNSIRELEIRIPSNYGDFVDWDKMMIHRVMQTDFEDALQRLDESTWFADPNTSTIFYHISPAGGPVRYPGDWVTDLGRPGDYLEHTPAYAWALRRIKELFDPTNKLNPGILGIV